MMATQPMDAPPTYEAAVGTSSSPANIRRVSTDGPGARTIRNGIPPEHRRSMEDENRELPPGWIRQFDPQEQHQFFVDTNADPPRSIWVHPYDDPEYLDTLSPDERKKHTRLHKTMSIDDITAEDSDDDENAHHSGTRKQTAHPGAGGPNSTSPPPHGLHKFGRRMKDKITGSTHQQRQQNRLQREEQERRAYVAHLRTRQAMVRALESGEPQFLCKDREGRDVYVMPPRGPMAPRGAFGYNPYVHGPFGNPHSRYLRPAGPYGRPYGYGYGGGLGAPVAAGFLGGAMMGGLLF